MSMLLWKVLDNRVVEACLGPSAALAGLVVAGVLLPSGSGVEAAAWLFAAFAALQLISALITALRAGAREKTRARARP